MTDELYPIDQVEWNTEQTLFGTVMRAVIYRTQNIYFDGVKDSEDATAVICQLWTGEPLPLPGETMSWYAIDKVSLRQLAPERLIAETINDVERIRDANIAFWRDSRLATDEDIEREWRNHHPDGDRWRLGLLAEDRT